MVFCHNFLFSNAATIDVFSSSNQEQSKNLIRDPVFADFKFVVGPGTVDYISDFVSSWMDINPWVAVNLGREMLIEGIRLTQHNRTASAGKSHEFQPLIIKTFVHCLLKDLSLTIAYEIFEYIHT